MSIYHLKMKKSNSGNKRLSPVAHLEYITGDGKYKNKKNILENVTENLPEEFKNIKEFWKFSEAYERSNANLYRELEISLPREFSIKDNKKLVEEFCKVLFGKEYVYNYSIHEPSSFDGEINPHVHIMFCERKLDGINRGKEQFFSRYNPNNPEKGGAKKNNYWEKKTTLLNIREDWENLLNYELEKRGFEKVTRKSLIEQKIILEKNGEIEKAKNLDRTPIEIEGYILYTDDKKLTEEEQLKKENFYEKRILKNESEKLKKLLFKIKKLKEKLSKLSKKDYEILEEIRKFEDEIENIEAKKDIKKIENTVYNLMSNKEYYNLLNENKKIDKQLKFETKKNVKMQLENIKKENIEKIENIKKI